MLYDSNAAGGRSDWFHVPEMSRKRQGHTAVLLPMGTVLVAGGSDAGHAIASVEILNLQTMGWRSAPSMATARASHTATVLPTGQVLVVGGVDGGTFHASAEVYDPLRNSWSTAGQMSTARAYHTATLLTSGKVLVLGDGSTTRRISPVQVPGLSGVTAIEAGLNHTLALIRDQRVVAWGDGLLGQLGDGTSGIHPIPVQVRFP